MKITKDKKSKQKAKQIGGMAGRFVQLQEDIRKKRQRNASLRMDIDALLAEYQNRILPHERRLVQPMSALLQRLIDFFAMKSLTRWQRDELVVWIHETLEMLGRLDSEAAQTMGKAFNQKLADYFNMSVEQLDKIQAEEDDIEAIVEQLFREMNPEDGDEDVDLQDDLFGFDESEPAAEQNENPEPVVSKKPAPAFGEEWIKSLFRRTAKILHPDREQDEQRRNEKHILMSQLLTARDAGDVMAMIELYTTHVADAQAEFTEAEYQDILVMLEDQLQRLDEESDDIVNATTFHHFLYRRLYSRQKAARERKIKAYLAQIDEDIQVQMEGIAALRTLKDLKMALEVRLSHFDDVDMKW